MYEDEDARFEAFCHKHLPRLVKAEVEAYYQQHISEIIKDEIRKYLRRLIRIEEQAESDEETAIEIEESDSEDAAGEEGTAEETEWTESEEQ